MAFRNNQGLIVFVKNKEEGKVKTRLAKTVGDSAALDIYEQLLDIIKGNLQDLFVPVYIYYSSFKDEEENWGNGEIYKKLQSGFDLGEKMRFAFQETLSVHNQVIIIGSDCPALDKKMIKDAFTALQNHDVVIGPTLDGGYYLLGLKEDVPSLFEGIPWSTNDVTKITLEKIKDAGLLYFLLPELRDVDDEEDWKYYQLTGIL